MTFTSPERPDPSKLQRMKEEIAKAAGVDVANVTLAVDSLSGTSVITTGTPSRTKRSTSGSSKRRRSTVACTNQSG